MIKPLLHFVTCHQTVHFHWVIYGSYATQHEGVMLIALPSS
jgi:hypothetical protein